MYIPEMIMTIIYIYYVPIDGDFLKWWIPSRHLGFIKSGVTVRDPKHRQPRFEVTFLRVVWSLLRWEPRDGMARVCIRYTGYR